MPLYPFFDPDADAYGYTDAEGRLVIPARFEDAEEFRNGLAVVQHSNGATVIDTSGRELIPAHFFLVSTQDGWIHAFERRAQSLYDATGKLWLRLEDVQHIHYPEDGLLRVKKAGGWGVLDLEGRERIPFTYCSLGPCQHGRIPYNEAGYGAEGWGWLDYDGNVRVPAQFIEVGFWDEQTWWGRRPGSRFEVYDLHEERRSPLVFHELGPLSGPAGIARSDRGWHYFGPGFTPLLDLPSAYTEARRFQEGRAAVRRDGRWGFIDLSGNEVIPARYPEVFNFSEGLAAVRQEGRWGFIDTAGNERVPPHYEAAGPFSEGLAAVKQQGNWGYIRPDGAVQLPFSFSSAGAFRGSRARVDDSWHAWKIDREGTCVSKREDLWD